MPTSASCRARRFCRLLCRFFHRRDLDGLRAVAACAPRHRVVCTPSLGRAAKKLACEVAELPKLWLPFVAGLGLGFAGGGFTYEVTDTDVLGAFARASAEFMRDEARLACPSRVSFAECRWWEAYL